MDFGEFHAAIAGSLLKRWLFVLRLSCWGRAFDVASATQAQEAFLEGHVLAFDHFDAVPARVRYDNLKPAVIRVLRGRDRAEAERFIALRSHCGSFLVLLPPGNAGAHEKGDVENEIGRFRRRHLVPVPPSSRPCYRCPMRPLIRRGCCRHGSITGPGYASGKTAAALGKHHR